MWRHRGSPPSWDDRRVPRQRKPDSRSPRGDAVRGTWSPWVEFTTTAIGHPPHEAGLYRIRTSDAATLAYLGQTGRGLRERLLGLRRGTFAEAMPYNDPHTAAPGLWAFRNEESVAYEVSWMPMPEAAERDLHTAEARELADHRLTHGVSTLLNHGRHHRYWTRPSNRDGGLGRRGERRLVPEPYESAPTLPRQGVVGQDGWMGLRWSSSNDLRPGPPATPDSPGLYLLTHDGEVIYIGQSRSIRQRVRAHGRSDWPAGTTVRWSNLSCDAPPHQLLELEADLLGAYIAANGTAPIGQFSGWKTL